MKFKIWHLLISVALFYGCVGNDDDAAGCVEETPDEQADTIDMYAAANGLDVQTTPSGLRYVINTPGMGDNAQLGDTLEVSFEGFLMDGTSFGQGVFDPFEFGTLSLIPGFAEGLSLMNEGSQATLILPSALAYGCFPPQGSGIGQNEILIFEVTMLSISP